jgi:hypothetical protein
MAAGKAAAQERAGRFTADSINRGLSKDGLPTSSVLEAAKLSLNPSITSPELSSSNTEIDAVAEATVEQHQILPSVLTPVIVEGILGIADTYSLALEMGTLATSVNARLAFADF